MAKVSAAAVYPSRKYEAPRPNESSRWAGLDALRALAIIAVFCSHYPKYNRDSWLFYTGHLGSSGVDLFFVLSGFLIAGQLFAPIVRGKLPKLEEFFVKRAFRILPGYWFVLFLYFSIPVFREHRDIAPLSKFLTFTMNWGLDLSTQRAFSHAWSLCVEEHFYLFLPFLVMTLGLRTAEKRFPQILLSVLVVGFFARSLSWIIWNPGVPLTDQSTADYYRLVYYPTYNRMDSILVGVGLQWIRMFRGRLWQSFLDKAPYLLLGSIATLTIGFTLFDDKYSFAASVPGFLLLSLGYGALLVAAIRWSDRMTGLWLLPVIWIADWSYAIYLTHKPVIRLFHFLYLVPRGWDRFSPPAFVVTSIVVLLVGFTLRVVIELPAKALRDLVLERRHRGSNSGAPEKGPVK